MSGSQRHQRRSHPVAGCSQKDGAENATGSTEAWERRWFTGTEKAEGERTPSLWELIFKPLAEPYWPELRHTRPVSMEKAGSDAQPRGGQAHLSSSVCRQTPALPVSFPWPFSLPWGSTCCPCPPRGPRPTLEVTCCTAGGSHTLAEPPSWDPLLAPEVSWLLRGAPGSWTPPPPPPQQQPSLDRCETEAGNNRPSVCPPGWARPGLGRGSRSIMPAPSSGQGALSWAVLRLSCPSCDAAGHCPAPCSPLMGRAWDSLQSGPSLLLLTCPKPLSAGTWPSQQLSWVIIITSRMERGELEDADSGYPCTWPPWPRQRRGRTLPAVAAVWGWEGPIKSSGLPFVIFWITCPEKVNWAPEVTFWTSQGSLGVSDSGKGEWKIVPYTLQVKRKDSSQIGIFPMWRATFSERIS